MFSLYAIGGVTAILIGLWVTIKIVRAKNFKLEVEKKHVEAQLIQADRIIKSNEKVQDIIRNRREVRVERIKNRVEKDVEDNNFSDFYD